AANTTVRRLTRPWWEDLPSAGSVGSSDTGSSRGDWRIAASLRSARSASPGNGERSFGSAPNPASICLRSSATPLESSSSLLTFHLPEPQEPCVLLRAL